MRRPENVVYDVLVLGAGASGLMCAWRAALRGKKVLIVEHGHKPARKLAITGGGKCNCTNRQVSHEDYVGKNPQFCRSALSRFPPDLFMEMLRTAGIALEEREHGQMFCRRSAMDMVRWLADGCAGAGCALALDNKVLELKRAPDPGKTPVFLARTSQGEYCGHTAVIALGGPAWPQIGATGSGMELARRLGHAIAPLRPALAGLVMPEGWPLTGLEGISAPVDITVSAGGDNDKKGGKAARAASSLDLLFTHTGISGPAALQASLYWQKGMELEINFLPAQKLESLLEAPGNGRLLCRNLLRRLFPDRLADALAPPEPGGLKCASLSRAMRDLLGRRVHAYRVFPTGTEGFSKAEVTAGGVDTEAVSSRTMESRLVPGLYFCGEVLDVAGRLGGYNLHWAFASGFIAGESV